MTELERYLDLYGVRTSETEFAVTYTTAAEIAELCDLELESTDDVFDLTLTDGQHIRVVQWTLH